MDVRFASGLHDWDEVLEAGTEALGAFLTLVSYAAKQNRTDGHVSVHALRWCTDEARATEALKKSKLVTFHDDTGLIELHGHGEFWRFHDTRTVSAKMRREVIARDGKCVYCGATENLTVDHVEPRVRGGSHELGNLAAACAPCNSSKNNRTPAEWARGDTVKKGLRR